MTGKRTQVEVRGPGEDEAPEAAPRSGWMDELTPRQIVRELDRYIVKRVAGL